MQFHEVNQTSTKERKKEQLLFPISKSHRFHIIIKHDHYRFKL